MNKIEFRVEAVILNGDGEMLLGLHKKKGDAYWVLPGGHLEFGEKMDEALRRELKEELGLSAQVMELVFTDEFIDTEHEEKRHVIKAGFLVRIKKKDAADIKVVAEDESITEARFFSVYGIESSFDKFYPSKEFLLKLMESAEGFDMEDEEDEVPSGQKA
jgi:nucleoside triphosphatase